MNAEDLQTFLSVIKIDVFELYFKGNLHIFICLIQLTALLLHICKLIIVLALLSVFVLVELLLVVKLGLIVLVCKQEHVTLILNFLLHVRAVLIIHEHILLITGELILVLDQEVKNGTVLHVDHMPSPVHCDFRDLEHVESVKQYFLLD